MGLDSLNEGSSAREYYHEVRQLLGVQLRPNLCVPRNFGELRNSINDTEKLLLAQEVQLGQWYLTGQSTQSPPRQNKTNKNQQQPTSSLVIHASLWPLHTPPEKGRTTDLFLEHSCGLQIITYYSKDNLQVKRRTVVPVVMKLAWGHPHFKQSLSKCL